MKQITVGLVGAGAMARVHAESWSEIGASLAVHSTGGAQALARDFDAQHMADLDSLLRIADVVDIVAPTPVHAQVALRAIAAGRHVICEKPLARSSALAEQIIVAGREAGVRVFLAHVVRYFPAYARIKQHVDAGRIGDVAVMRFSRGGSAPAAGSWFLSEPASGGIVLDLMIHDIDQALWLAGDVVQVYAVQNPATDRGVVPGIVIAHAVLTHAGGAISHLQGMWGAQGLPFGSSIHVSGSSGVLSYDSRGDGGALVVDVPSAREQNTFIPARSHGEDPYTLELRAFASAIGGGPEPRVSAADGLKAITVAEAAARSIATGSAVDVDTSSVGRGHVLETRLA